MRKQFFIFLFAFVLFASFAYADNITVGSLFYPDSVDWIYNVTQQINCDNITVNDTCVIISGGTYAGSYCFNKTSLYIEDVLLFPGTPMSCYTEIDMLPLTVPVSFEWINSTGTVLKSGSNTCEDATLCLVDVLEGSYVQNPGDSIYCRLTVTQDFFTFTSNSSSETINSLGVCDATKPYPILNLTYYDEITGQQINTTNVYNLTFSSGFGGITIEGTFSGNQSDVFCSNVNPATDNLVMNVYGEIILSANDYVTRVFNIPQAVPFIANNNPVGEQNLTLIKVANSTTVTFNWQTTEFQTISGTMLIYRCEDNNTKTLIESILVSNGQAYANLQLLLTAYSYEIVIDGQVFTDDDFTACHIESVTERTYYVDTTGLDLLPVIGLFLVDCSLTKISNNTARMQWEENSQDSSAITACIVAKRRIVDQWTEIYRNCSTASYGNITRSIPDNGNEYIVYGEITQDSDTAYCQNELHFFATSGPANLFGHEALIGVIILLIVLTLIYAESGTSMLVAILFATSSGFILNILKVPWATFYAMIIYILTIIVINRYTQKKAVE